MALIPETYDQDYMNSARIFVRGGAEGVDIDPSVPVVEFTDPESGLTYVAMSQLDDAGEEVGVGARMLLYADQLRINGATTAMRRFVDNIDVVRQLSWRLSLGG